MWIAAFFWPFSRVIGLLSTAPIYGNKSVPARTKIGLSVIITVIIAPVLPPVPSVDPFSLIGVAVAVQQFIIGAAMGFTMRIIFAAVEYAGELMGFTMGLGFATFFDPNTQGQSSAISQFLAILMFMLFLSTDTHLLLLAAVTDSFNNLPIAATPLKEKGFYSLALWAGTLFSVGLQIAMPIIGAMLIINLAMAILTRAAPQLNLFGIGFPILLMTGFAIIVLVLPYALPVLTRWMETGLAYTYQVPILVKP